MTATTAEKPARPVEIAERALAAIARRGEDAVWISVVPAEALMNDARDLERRHARGEPLPLYGQSFAVKDNIDVAGLPTTAACPALATTPARHATVVARLVHAGALCVGKTNLDQLATGLTGVRSPYGIPRNLFDERYVVGGSSSGSAVAVAAGLVDFALGTDTAGSGRVPAAFNNIVGLKPSRGIFSTAGVVPACPSLDCVSIFSLTVEDAQRVAELARGADDADPFSRPEADGFAFTGAVRPPRFRFAVPAPAALDFRGDAAAAVAFAHAVDRIRALGGEPIEIDFAPFREAGALVYEGAYVAERLIAGGDLLARDPEALLPPVRTILTGARSIGARAAFDTQRKVAQLRRTARRVLAGVDFLLVPTTPTIPRIADVQADPLRLNAALGAFTTFVNPLDLAALAVPGGFRDDGLPAGVTLVGPWGSDARLAAFGTAIHRATSDRLGALDRRLPAETAPAANLPDGWIRDRRRRRAPLGRAAQSSAHRPRRAVPARGPHHARLPPLRAAQHHPAQAGPGAGHGRRRPHRAGGLGSVTRRLRHLRGQDPGAAGGRTHRARRRHRRQRLLV